MYSLGKNVNIEDSKKEVLKVLDNGFAKNKFYQWITSQNGDLNKMLISNKILTIHSDKKGYISEINPIQISKIVSSLGAGREKKEDKINTSVGVAITKTINEKVEKGDELMKIYYDYLPKDIEKVASSSIKIESIPQKEKDIIISVIK